MSIQYRCTTLACLFVNTVSSSSTVQLGDGRKNDLTSKALAIQRAVPNNVEDEYRFASYRIFSLPKLTLLPCANVRFQSRSPLPCLEVGSVRTLGVSASSILRVGNTGPLQAVARIKHIRHFNDRGIR
ncbi:spore germination protein GerPE [Cohnella cholangitidis]|uniref:Spore germination protein GerPE n=1 Tax=Cohnella cholangitidis TaxID=2598458 RepID=A0A7G5C4T2_9BACL|nr:spore germination protein GerPE [Cohnella cholangitidis]QMV44216.1 spore germination protein GerPE [Cohnella cholangitidis]